MPTGFITGGLSGFGVTGGAHRFWTHRSYKANALLRTILMLCFTLSGQNSIYEWVRDHRVHHKFSETDAGNVDESREISSSDEINFNRFTKTI